MFFCHGTSHSAGIAILLRRFPGNVIDSIGCNGIIGLWFTL